MRIQVALLRLRVARAWAAAVAAWQDNSASLVKTPRKRRQLGALIRRPLRWLNDHLVQGFALLLALALAGLLAKRIRQAYTGTVDPSLKDLVLLGLVMAAAFLAQSGNDLLSRLRKVGPVEFIERQYDRIVPEIEEIGEGELGSLEQPSERLLWEYEKAENYVTHLEATGLDLSDLSRNEKLHDLLYKMSKIAMMTGHWARVVDRLEFLLKITDGRFQAGRTHYRCGVSYRKLAAKEKRLEEKGELFRKAENHLWKAVKDDPHLYLAHHDLAIVQFHLQEYSLAIENNKKAIAIFSRYAPTKYNLAACYLRLGQNESALDAILSIKPDDEEVQRICTIALTDDDLAPLFDDPEQGEKARGHLETLKP